MAFYYPTQNKAGNSDSSLKEIHKGLKTCEAQAKVTGSEKEEMILKDNDCGVAKDGLVKQAKLRDPAASMDSSTYAKPYGIRRSR